MFYIYFTFFRWGSLRIFYTAFIHLLFLLVQVE